MYEANRMAGYLVETLNDAGVRDGGADYRITVSDTAGSIAEVLWDKEHKRWHTEGEGFDREVMFTRAGEYDGGYYRCGVCGQVADRRLRDILEARQQRFKELVAERKRTQ